LLQILKTERWDLRRGGGGHARGASIFLNRDSAGYVRTGGEKEE